MKSQASTKGVYLYCFAHSALLPPIQGTGVDGARTLFSTSFKDLVAVVSPVLLDEFCGGSAESRMQDLSWVGPRAYHHEDVVEWVMLHSPCLPVRFGTIFRSVKSLGHRMKHHYVPIIKFLSRVSDKEEWAVKGIWDRTRTREYLFAENLAREKKRLDGLSAGMRYLEEKRIASKVETELKVRIEKERANLAKALEGFAAEFSERKILPRPASENETMVMVWNFAFLVPRAAFPNFRAQIDRWNARPDQTGLACELSGPWPPYSFSPQLDLEAES